MRPQDRDAILRDLGSLFSGKSGKVPRTYVVATQCLEVGADLDFHALVTECASLDALRQRFGQLNRVAARPSARGVVVDRGDQTDPEKSDSDPVYADRVVKTWRWLRGDTERDEIDFGVASIRELTSALTPAQLHDLSEDTNLIRD